MNSIQPKLRRPYFDALFKVITVLGLVILAGSWKLAPALLVPSLLIGGLIYLGFGLPRWVGWAERQDRARHAKKAEQAKWGFHSRDREGPWLNYVDYPLLTKSPIAHDKYFYSEWLIIHNGWIVVNPGPTKNDPDKATKEVEYDFTVRRTYAWDGCSPKRWFFWIALFGTPDWGDTLENIVTINDQGDKEYAKVVLWQRAHHASLVHDALYQYLDEIPIDKQDVNQLFREMLEQSGFCPWIASIYYHATQLFGANDVGAMDSKFHPNHNFELANEPEFLKN